MSRSRIRVLWLIKGLGLGGAERMLASAVPYLDHDRFEYRAAYFLPWKDALVGELEAGGVPVTCLGAGWAWDLRAAWRTVRLLREWPCELVHAHLPWAGLVGRVAARISRIPAVVYTEHGSWKRLHPLMRWAMRCTLWMNDLTIAVSPEAAASTNGHAGDRLRMIPNAVDCRSLEQIPNERSQVRRELAIPPEAFVVGVVANLTPVKRHEVLIEAFAQFAARHPEAWLVAVGQLCGREAHLRRWAERLGVSGRVLFTGPRHDVPRILRAFDVFALASKTEGLPVSLLEAMACRLPVVCTRVGGIPMAVEDGQEGFLVEAESPVDLADRLSRLAADSHLRRRMGEAARSRVRRDFDIAAIVERTERLYLELVDNKGRRDADHPVGRRSHG